MLAYDIDQKTFEFLKSINDTRGYKKYWEPTEVNKPRPPGGMSASYIPVSQASKAT
jgi:hypothetical protein